MVISSDEELKMNLETKNVLETNLKELDASTPSLMKRSSLFECELIETKRISKINQPYTPQPTPKKIRDTKKSAS